MSIEKGKKMDILSKYQIVHNAYVDLIRLLKSISGFFNDNKYDFREIGIGEKPTDLGYELKSEWLAEREVTDYIRFHFKIFILARDIKKVKLDTGEDAHWARLFITIDSHIEKNWNGTFPSGHWGELKRQLYERYLIKGRLEVYKGKLYGESMQLVEALKSHLK